MELIERYLQAVKFWLPKQQKDDIIAELSEDIHAQIEEQETELGHRLSEVEVEAFLKRRGRPVVVANRYLPQQYLIGPLLFPVYRFVLKIVVLCYLIPWLVVAASLKIWLPAAARSIPGSFLLTAFLAFAAVTIVFVVLERVQAKSNFLENWNPHKLPAMRNPNLIPRSSSSAELAINLLFVVWWAANMYTPGGVLLTPLWVWFFWGFLLLALANAGLAAMNLIHPHWTAQRALLRLGADCAGSALFCWLMKANVLAGLSVASLSAERSAALTSMINGWLTKAFPMAVVVCVVIATVDVARILRLNRKPQAGTAD